MKTLPNGKAKLTLLLPEALIDEIKYAAVDQRTSASRLLEQMARDGLKRIGRAHPTPRRGSPARPE